jgi:hypothetical protein
MSLMMMLVLMMRDATHVNADVDVVCASVVVGTVLKPHPVFALCPY